MRAKVRFVYRQGERLDKREVLATAPVVGRLSVGTTHNGPPPVEYHASLVVGEDPPMLLRWAQLVELRGDWMRLVGEEVIPRGRGDWAPPRYPQEWWCQLIPS